MVFQHIQCNMLFICQQGTIFFFETESWVFQQHHILNVNHVMNQSYQNRQKGHIRPMYQAHIRPIYHIQNTARESIFFSSSLYYILLFTRIHICMEQLQNTTNFFHWKFTHFREQSLMCPDIKYNREVNSRLVCQFLHSMTSTWGPFKTYLSNLYLYFTFK